MLAAVGLVVLARSGNALKCWDCASNMNPTCGDPMNTTEHQLTFQTRTCTASPYETSRSICRKIVKKEYGERVVIRQCSTPNNDEMDILDGPCGSSATMGRSVIESCHICSTDLCNSATNPSGMYLLCVAALALVGFRFLQTNRNVV